MNRRIGFVLEEERRRVSGQLFTVPGERIGGERHTIFWPPGPLPFKNDSSISSSGGGFGRGGRFLLPALRSGGLLVVLKQQRGTGELGLRRVQTWCRNGNRGRRRMFRGLGIAIAVLHVRASRGRDSFDVDGGGGWWG